MKRFGRVSMLSIVIALGAASCGGDDAAQDVRDTAAVGEVDSSDVGASDAGDDVDDVDSAEEDAIPTQPDGGLPLLGGDCDPLVPTVCALPFPSNVYLVDGAAGPSVRFGATTMIARKDGARVPVDLFADHDGFSAAAALLAHLPGATLAGCAGPYDIARSLEDDSPTVLIDAETGEREPHWVELDQGAAGDAPQLFMIRPARRLKDGTRYIVAIRKIQDASGRALAPSPVSAALIAGTPLLEGSDAERWTVHARRELYRDIVARLDGAGVTNDGLLLAWDFTTASRDFVTGPLVRMRDLALAAVGEDGPSFEVASVEEFPSPEDNANLLRRIELDVELPLYLTTGQIEFTAEQPLARLSRGPDGDLVQNGTMRMRVLVLVPRSVATGERHGLLQNGHGLFGSRREGQGGYLARAANDYRYIAFAMNLFGFDEDTVPLATQVLLGRFEGLKSIPERQIQGMVNQLLAMRMMMGRVAKDGIRGADGEVLLDAAWIDPNLRAYRGDSQGGIMGATYMAVSTDVTRGLIGEPGMPYSLLLPRSVDWDIYHAVLQIGFGSDSATQHLFLALLQMSWDRVEPGGFAPFVERDPLPGTPVHHVLMHVARGDHQVSVHGARVLARSIGAAQLVSDDGARPVWESIYGLEEVAAPVTDRSVLVEYDFALPESPADNVPQREGCDPHDRVRVLTPSYVQMDAFFRTGTIAWACRGACDCDDTGASPEQEDGCPESYASQCE